MKKKFSPNLWPRPKKPLNNEDALNYAYYLLGRQQYSEQRLLEKIKLKFDFSAADDGGKRILAEVMSKLHELSLLDDLNYARVVVRNCLEYKTVGREKIRQILRLKKLPSDVIGRVLEEMPCEEVARAMVCLQKKINFLQRLPDQQSRKAKIARLLTNRGFSPTTIAEVLQKKR